MKLAVISGCVVSVRSKSCNHDYKALDADLEKERWTVDRGDDEVVL